MNNISVKIATHACLIAPLINLNVKYKSIYQYNIEVKALANTNTRNASKLYIVWSVCISSLAQQLTAVYIIMCVSLRPCTQDNKQTTHNVAHWH